MKNAFRFAAVAAVLLVSGAGLFAQYPLPQSDPSAPQVTCPGCSPIRTSFSGRVNGIGKVATVMSSNTVTGIGTSFLTQLKPGDLISIDGIGDFAVGSVPSNTTLTTAFAILATTPQPATYNVPAPVEKTFPFSAPIAAFTGRYLDSSFTQDFQQTFRTGRANDAIFVPSLNRIYMMIGSAVAAYDATSFINRLESRIVLQSAAQFLGQSGRNLGSAPAYNYEYYLPWDKYYYPEHDGQWQYSHSDGQDKLFGYAVDDRGYVYLCGFDYHWGIVKDDGSSGANLMTFAFEDPSVEIGFVMTFRTPSGKYYVMTGNAANQSKLDMWDSTTPQAGVPKVRTLPYYMTGGANTSTYFAGVSGDHRLLIWTGDHLAQGLAPDFTARSGISFQNVTSDGTNFYAAGLVGANGVIVKLTPSGASFVTQETSIPNFNPASIRYGSGNFLGITGNSIGGTVKLFKILSNSLAEVPFSPDFFYEYYSHVGDSTYGHPRGTNLEGHSALPIRVGNKQYVVVSAVKLGDVYQIASDDDVNVTSQGAVGTRNTNAPARINPGDVYYGDIIRFLASTSATSPKSITWDFDNKDATGDPNTPSGTTGVTITHQYSGLVPGGTPTSTPAGVGQKTVKATDPTTGVAGQVSLNLKMPIARFGITNITQLVTQAGTAASPILVGENFFDASDGDVEGHYAEWNIDTTPTKLTKPFAADNSHLVPVGACGGHALNFATHYGPYSASFVTNGPDFKVQLAPAGAFNYTVVPFAATLTSTPNPTSNSVTFSALAQATRDTSVFSAAQAAALTYQWDLVDANDAVVVTDPLAHGTGLTITPWNVTLDKFPNNQRNLRARLTLTSPTAPTGGCANTLSTKSYTGALNVADPQITGDCTNGGPPCNFSVSSIAGANIVAEGWTFSWSASPNAGFFPTTSATSTFSPTFTSTGTYTLTVSVTNSLGVKTATKNVTVTTAGSTCATMNPGINIFIDFHGPTSGCFGSNPDAKLCSAGEAVAFNVAAAGYDFTCTNNHSFSWDFGDNVTGVAGRTPSHVYSQNGTYTVKCTVGNGVDTKTLESVIKVGTTVQPPTPTPPVTPPTPPVTPPGNGSCPTMTNINWSIAFAGTNCNHISGSCKNGDVISFSAAPFIYPTGCANHTFTWNWGDNSIPSIGMNVTHTYPNGGDYNVSLTIQNPQQTFTIPVVVHVSGTVVTPPTPTPPVTPPVTPGSCQQMTSVNTFITYRGPSSNCNHNNETTPCNTGETLAMSAQFFGYNTTCATHTFTWDFGDGTPGASGQDVTHAYQSANTYTAKVTVSNGSQTFPATIAIKVGGIPVTGGVTADFTYAFDAHSPTLVNFTPSVDPATTGVTKVVWDFGDGNQTTKGGAQPMTAVTNTYAARTQPYTVTMTITTSTGGVVSRSHAVTINNPSRRRGAPH